MMERIRGIWSMVRWYVYNIPERIARKVAFVLPSKVAYWATLRLGAHATTGQYSNQIVPDLTFSEALERWEREFAP